MRFEEFAKARLPALLRYAAVFTGDRELAREFRHRSANSPRLCHVSAYRTPKRYEA